MKKITQFCSLFILAAGLSSCSKNGVSDNARNEFNPSVLSQEMQPAKLVSGQLLYMPVYSNVPYDIDTVKFDMSAFIAIHNTDIFKTITLTRVLYFDQDGKLVNDYLRKGAVKIGPLATRDFYVPYADQSGTGANFLIEWIADTLVCEPLIESVTTCLKPNNTLAIISEGKIIREKK